MTNKLFGGELGLRYHKFKEVKSNLFDTDAEVIAHGCNAMGVMGSGVALQIRERYPQAYYEYARQAAILREMGNTLQLGSVIPVICGDRIIANMITQMSFGGDGRRYVSYDAVYDSMKSLCDYMYEQGLHKIAMPKIGAGLGGGDWEVLAHIIEHVALNAKSPLSITVHSFE